MFPNATTIFARSESARLVAALWIVSLAIPVSFASQNPVSPNSIVGFTEDEVSALFGLASSRMPAPDGTSTWSYDDTTSGEVTIDFSGGKVIRMVPDRTQLIQELQRKATEKRRANPPSAERPEPGSNAPLRGIADAIDLFAAQYIKALNQIIDGRAR
jgi:hypothetical protein